MIERKEELRGLIRQAREAYYGGRPIVPDDVYDAWYDELAALDSNDPEIKAVGANAVSEWTKVAHKTPMGSLGKVNTFEEMTAWVLGRTRSGQVEKLLVTEKFDGISCSVAFVEGRMVQALTRGGDDQLGEDITVNVRRMKGIPARLQKPFTGRLRGEILVYREDLAVFFPEAKSTRNTAAGTAQRYDGKGCEHLHVYFYGILEHDGSDGLNPGVMGSDNMAFLESLGLDVGNWYQTAMAPTLKTPHDLWVEYQQHRRETLPYDIDGLVVSLDDLAYHQSLGSQNDRPNGSVAFKFAPITRETTLRAIENGTGGAGHVTPVAIFDPVNILGATVTNATLYNWKYVADLGLDIGAKILVARANDVIPRVMSVVRGTGTVAAAPTTCASCGHELVRRGEYHVCPNASGCPAQAVGRIHRYVDSLGIKEWGDTLIWRLVDQGMVRSVPDMYRLTLSSVAGVERMGEKSAKKVVDNLWARNPLLLDELLGAMSIPLCAAATIRMAMDAGYDTWDKIRVATVRDLERVPGLGPAKAKALHAWLSGSGSAVVPELLGMGVRIQDPVVGKLTGKSFCFTGTMRNKRADLEAQVQAAGGTVKDRAVKGLHYLVLSDPTSSSSKAQAARKNGTKCISEDEFLSMVGG